MTVPRRHPSARRAFTLVEIIVVMIIVAILAAVIVPRFTGNTLRASLNESQSVESLLTIAAQKSLLSGQPVTLAWDGSAKVFSLQVLRPVASGAAKSQSSSGNVNGAEDPSAWRTDPLVEPAALTLSTLKQSLVDSRPMPAAAWHVVFQPGEHRPDIRLVLEPAGAPPGSRIDVALTPESSAATRSGFGVTQRPGAGPRVVDLDDTGKGDRSW